MANPVMMILVETAEMMPSMVGSKDIINGNAGNDALFGDGNDDTINGNGGNDVPLEDLDMISSQADLTMIPLWWEWC